MSLLLESIGTIKSLAKLIERKYPGTCDGLINEIDQVQNNPLYLKERMKDIEEKWENIKDYISSIKDPEVSEKVSNFDLTNTEEWKNLVDRHILRADIVEDGSFWDSLIDDIGTIFEYTN